MEFENAIRRAQLYGFLAEVFLYPLQDWTQDVALVLEIARALGLSGSDLKISPASLEVLQAAYRHTFGAAGSLCYETEYGLPHAYRQSQELADIAGFYAAFGLGVGGAERERPDHLAVELEFLHVLALKEAYAYQTAAPELAQICQEAQRKFLQDHLGCWIDLFAQSVARNAPDSPFVALARFAASLVNMDADRLGIKLKQLDLTEVPHTPFDPDFSCASCEQPGQMQGLIRADSIQ